MIAVKKIVHIIAYVAIYLLIPMYLLLLASDKYPEIITRSVLLTTLIYLVTLFILSVMQIFVRWKSIPSVGIFIATVFYMNLMLSNMKFKYQSAVITIDLGNLLFIIYILLSLRTALVIWDDLKNRKTIQEQEGSRHDRHSSPHPL